MALPQQFHRPAGAIQRQRDTLKQQHSTLLGEIVKAKLALGAMEADKAKLERWIAECDAALVQLEATPLVRRRVFGLLGPKKAPSSAVAAASAPDYVPIEAPLPLVTVQLSPEEELKLSPRELALRRRGIEQG
jgi:hypothetical protein